MKPDMLPDDSKLDIIQELLQGKLEDRNDSGLVGDVEKNTDFRKRTEAGRDKMFWFAVSTFIGLIAKIIYDAIK